MENSMKCPQKFEKRTTVWSSNYTSGYLSEGKKNTLIWKDIFIHYVHCSIIYNIAMIWKQPKCPLMNEWKRSGVKKNETLPFATAWMDLERIMLCEKSQAEKSNTVWFHLYVECKKPKKLDKQNRNRLADAENK